MIEKMYFPSKHTKVKKCEIFMKFNLGVVSTQRTQKNIHFVLKKHHFSDIINRPPLSGNRLASLFSFQLVAALLNT